MQLNHRSLRLLETVLADAESLRFTVTEVGGARVIDCGVDARGGLAAGVAMARAALADLGMVTLRPTADAPGTACTVEVHTDQPIWACLASQYAGWPIQTDDYFAMGSGPMRHLRGREPLLEEFPPASERGCAVGLLEAPRLPTASVIQLIAEECGVDPAQLTLLVAPTRSIAGSLQVVARSIETALHKLHELAERVGCRLDQVVSAAGTAPLPPPAPDDLEAIGRTNDAILYGAHVTLWMDADASLLADLAQRLPSSASSDYGAPFREIFDRAGGDFYAIDPLLFSPARVTLVSTRSGDVVTEGAVDHALLARSFGETSK